MKHAAVQAESSKLCRELVAGFGLWGSTASVALNVEFRFG